MDDPCFWCDGTGTIACARQFLGWDGEVTCETWFEGICGACGGSGRRAAAEERGARQPEAVRAVRGERLGVIRQNPGRRHR